MNKQNGRGMPQDLLFNYLDTPLRSALVIATLDIDCRKRTNSKNIPYYLLDTKEGIGFCIDHGPSSYKLINHHISVYEDAANNPIVAMG